MEKFKVIIVEDVPLELKGTKEFCIMKCPKPTLLLQPIRKRHSGENSDKTSPTLCFLTRVLEAAQRWEWRFAAS